MNELEKGLAALKANFGEQNPKRDLKSAERILSVLEKSAQPLFAKIQEESHKMGEQFSMLTFRLECHFFGYNLEYFDFERYDILSLTKDLSSTAWGLSKTEAFHSITFMVTWDGFKSGSWAFQVNRSLPFHFDKYGFRINSGRIDSQPHFEKFYNEVLAYEEIEIITEAFILNTLEEIKMKIRY